MNETTTGRSRWALMRVCPWRVVAVAVVLLSATACGGDDDPVIIRTATRSTGIVPTSTVPPLTAPPTIAPPTTAPPAPPPTSVPPTTEPSTPPPTTVPSPAVATVDEAIALVGEMLARQVPDPQFDVSPSVEQGAIVDYGLWLALANGDPVSVQAGADEGPWARATATVSSTRWEMGNDDVVTCDGPGVAITPGSPEFDSPAPGPCGYQYPAVSQDGEPFTLTVTATWEVAWTASDGRTGSSSVLVRTASHPYRVFDWVVGPPG